MGKRLATSYQSKKCTWAVTWIPETHFLLFFPIKRQLRYGEEEGGDDTAVWWRHWQIRWRSPCTGIYTDTAESPHLGIPFQRLWTSNMKTVFFLSPFYACLPHLNFSLRMKVCTFTKLPVLRVSTHFRGIYLQNIYQAVGALTDS